MFVFNFVYSSTCHGAGRALSRAKSRRNIDYQSVLDKLQAQGISIRVASPKLVIIIYFSGSFIKSDGLCLRPSKSSHDPVVVMKFEFCVHSARLLRKLDHVLLWILTTEH